MLSLYSRLKVLMSLSKMHGRLVHTDIKWRSVKNNHLNYDVSRIKTMLKF